MMEIHHYFISAMWMTHLLSSVTEKIVNCFLTISTHSTKISNLHWNTKKSDCISFLDVLVSRNEEGTIETSLYSKKTFSGLYMKFDSFVPPTLQKEFKVVRNVEKFNRRLFCNIYL